VLGRIRPYDRSLNSLKKKRKSSAGMKRRTMQPCDRKEKFSNSPSHCADAKEHETRGRGKGRRGELVARKKALRFFGPTSDTSKGSTKTSASYEEMQEEARSHLVRASLPLRKKKKKVGEDQSNDEGPLGLYPRAGISYEKVLCGGKKKTMPGGSISHPTGQFSNKGKVGCQPEKGISKSLKGGINGPS